MLKSLRHKIRLRDGRYLSWREYGVVNCGKKGEGYPIIFCHGNLNSKYFEPVWDKTDAITKEVDAHIIAVDRPGYGSSTIHHNRTYSDFVLDIQELANYHKLRNYAILGYSSGGPHALACYAAQQEGNNKVPSENTTSRISVCGLISSDAPYAQMSNDMVHKVYGVSDVTIEYALQRAKRNEQHLRSIYESVKNVKKKQIALKDLDCAIEQGYYGAAWDSVLEASSEDDGAWGIDWDQLQQINDYELLNKNKEEEAKKNMNSVAASANEAARISSKILLWHGDQDEDVPIEAGKYLANITNGKLFRMAGENHTLIRRHWKDILQAIIKEALLNDNHHDVVNRSSSSSRL